MDLLSSYHLIPCLPCKKLKHRCPVAQTDKGEPTFPCLTCGKRGIECIGGELIPLVSQKRKRRKAGTVVKPWLLAEERAVLGSASPNSTRSRLADGQLSLALTYCLIQEARCNSSSISLSYSTPTLESATNVCQMAVFSRAKILEEGFKGIEIAMGKPGRSEREKGFVEMKISLALFLGARHTNHSAVVGDKNSDPVTRGISTTAISTAGQARQHACQALANQREKVFGQIDFRTAMMAEKSLENIRFWISLFELSSSAWSDGEYVESQVQSSLVIAKLDQVQLACTRGAMAFEPGPEQKLVLQACKEMEQQIMYYDASKSARRKKHVPMSDSHLKKNHGWSAALVEAQLRQCLASNHKGSNIPHETREQLSIDAGIMFYRSLRALEGPSGPPGSTPPSDSTADTPPPALASSVDSSVSTPQGDDKAALPHRISYLLSLFKLGVQLLETCPALMQHIRSKLYVASDSGTLAVDFIGWTGRARKVLGQMEREFREVEGHPHSFSWKIMDMQEKGAQLMLLAAKDEMKWIKLMVDSDSSNSKTRFGISNAEVSAIATWASHRANEGLVDVAGRNVFRLLRGTTNRWQISVKEFGMDELKLVLAAQRVGSYIYSHLADEATKLEEVLDQLQALQDGTKGAAETIVKAALIELS